MCPVHSLPHPTNPISQPHALWHLSPPPPFLV
jgi:hypothetical protein